MGKRLNRPKKTLSEKSTDKVIASAPHGPPSVPLGACTMLSKAKCELSVRLPLCTKLAITAKARPASTKLATGPARDIPAYLRGLRCAQNGSYGEEAKPNMYPPADIKNVMM